MNRVYKSMKEFKERNFPKSTREGFLNRLAYEDPEELSRLLAEETLESIRMLLKNH